MEYLILVLAVTTLNGIWRLIALWMILKYGRDKDIQMHFIKGITYGKDKK